MLAALEAVVYYLKAPSTEFAGEGFESRVLAAVGDEVGGLAERLPADDALVRLLTWKKSATYLKTLAFLEYIFDPSEDVICN